MRDEEYFAIKDRAAAALRRIPHVTGVGIGGRERNGRPTGEIVIKVFVERKKPAADVPAEEMIPASFEGVSTDVVEMGPVSPANCTGGAIDPDDERLDPIWNYSAKHRLPVLLHTGTTFISQARLDYTLPRLLDVVAIRHPDVKIILAHLGHPFEGECVVTIRKHPNLYADVSALHYRPFQLYHSLMLVQEYGVWNKLLFGSDYPFTTVDASLEGMRALNDMLEGTRLPRLNMEKMEEMFFRDTLRVLQISA